MNIHNIILLHSEPFLMPQSPPWPARPRQTFANVCKRSGGAPCNVLERVGGHRAADGLAGHQNTKNIVIPQHFDAISDASGSPMPPEAPPEPLQTFANIREGRPAPF